MSLERRSALRSRSSLLVVPALLLSLSGGQAFPSTDAGEPSPSAAAFFETDVRPLLVERCWSCHGDAKAPKGGLHLTYREGVLQGGESGVAVILGKPDESPLIRAVRYLDEPRMPLKEKLKDREIEILSRWVAMGLPWPGTKPTTPPPTPGNGEGRFTDEQRRFWSFQPIKAVRAPEVRDAGWTRSTIDRFILATLEVRGFRPAAPADKRTLIRRATFDLIGLPPSPEEVGAFLADGSDEAFARVVDRLLASPRYGERWGRHWLDVVRYADARDLIQLPPESDFREVWRYRDWVVSAFNRDLPYPEFLRHQIAGDLLPPTEPGGINADGLIATGMLALADFVPGDVDKDQMIADYVNDEVDVIGRTFLGLSLACARCHDHKFDPISTEDYYALAGIFFSTRLVPGPVPGNTPLVRVPLLSPVEVAKIQAKDADDGRRRTELERLIFDAADREYVAFLNGMLLKETARYLVAACDVRGRPPETRNEAIELAKRRGLDGKILAGWVDYLGRIESQPMIARHPTLRDAASSRLTGPDLERSAGELQAANAARAETIASTNSPLARSSLIHLRADDPYLVTAPEGRVSLWPGRSGLPSDARAVGKDVGPTRVEAMIDGHAKTVLRFDGQSLMEAPRRAPPTGSLFAVFRTSETGGASQRLVGWEDSDVGKHGLGLMVDPTGPLRAILRDNGRSGDLVDSRRLDGFEIACVTWGTGGTALYRNGATVAGKGIESVSSDPGIAALHIGGPGSGNGARFRGDLAEIRVYDRPLDESERRLVEAELRDTWFKASEPNRPARDLLADLHEELISSRGPFWISAEQRTATLPEASRARLAAMTRELDELKKMAPREIPRAVAVQDGGPPGTRHEGLKDVQVFLRGNSQEARKDRASRLPEDLDAGEQRQPIAEGSGRRQLADWLARPDHPLTARVMASTEDLAAPLRRGTGPHGQRLRHRCGETATHPELLDHLAARFMEFRAGRRRRCTGSSCCQSAYSAGRPGCRRPRCRGPGQSTPREDEPPTPRCGVHPR